MSFLYRIFMQISILTISGIDRMAFVARAGGIISVELKEFEPSQTTAAWTWIKK